MINECNILIYSIFIFFCYSFVILNMALPLFRIVTPFIRFVYVAVRQIALIVKQAHKDTNFFSIIGDARG